MPFTIRPLLAEARTPIMMGVGLLIRKRGLYLSSIKRKLRKYFAL